MKKITKVILIILSLLIVLFVILLLGASSIFKDELKIMGSLHKIDPGLSAYTLEIEGDYHFDEFLQKGGASSDQEVSQFLTQIISHGFYSVEVTNQGPGCSVLSALDSKSNHVWGRNFDWGNAVPIIVKYTPSTGYASLSTCEFGNITGTSDTLPEDFINKMLAIASLYVPLDGINEAGLCVADLEVNEGGMLDIDTPKPDLTITTAIRLILDQAATVDEAIQLLEQYDIHPSGSISHHLAISDATGNSVVLEFVNGKSVIVPSPYVTNFNLANKDPEAGGESSKRRFDTLCTIFDQNSGILEMEQIQDALIATSQTSGKWHTQWSLLYDPIARSATYYFNGDFTHPYSFNIPTTP